MVALDFKNFASDVAHRIVRHKVFNLHAIIKIVEEELLKMLQKIYWQESKSKATWGSTIQGIVVFVSEEHAAAFRYAISNSDYYSAEEIRFFDTYVFTFPEEGDIQQVENLLKAIRAIIKNLNIEASVGIYY